MEENLSKLLFKISLLSISNAFQILILILSLVEGGEAGKLGKNNPMRIK